MHTCSRQTVAFITVFTLASAGAASAGPLYPFNGAPDNGTGAYDYHYAITGGKFPTGNIPNGTRASGGTMAYIYDDPYWGAGINVWHRDTWFAETAGQAMTFLNDGTTVYDNNGIEDGSYGDFYDAQAQGRTVNEGTPGLHQNYANANNFDFIYASYFKIEQTTTIDEIIGYFNGNGYYNTLANPNDPNLAYRFNIWSTNGADCTVAPGCLPVNTGSFSGDVFSTRVSGALNPTSYTNVDRVFVNGSTDPIWRVTFKLDTPLILAPGEYYGGHDRVLAPEPATLLLMGLGLGGAVLRSRRKQ